MINLIVCEGVCSKETVEMTIPLLGEGGAGIFIVGKREIIQRHLKVSRAESKRNRLDMARSTFKRRVGEKSGDSKM